MTRAIADHGVIGDGRTLALVAIDGTIDFLCWPRFDSPSLLAGLLDEDCGGAWAFAPDLDGVRHRQIYLPDTNVLLTRFLSEHGVAEVSDFMAVGLPDDSQRLVRRAKAVRGQVRFRMRFAPAFDYARGNHRVTRDGDALLFEADGLRLRLLGDRPLTIDGDAGVAEFELAPGESAAFVLAEADAPPTGATYVADAFKATSNFWREWTARSTYRGRWRDAVTRSALALKLLTSSDHGSIIAAGTFGLPETLGGPRNWDYRYVWMRDAAFTVYAFLRLGHVEEANAFMRWLRDRAREAGVRDGEGMLQLLYRVDGGEDLHESELPHLAGHAGSQPVRIGNAAADQLQLDIYGELMDAAYLSDEYGEQLSWEAWRGTTRVMAWLATNWERADEGIWEVRGGRRHFLHSRLMCWVALDRAIRLAHKRSLPAPLAEWRGVRDRIYHDIHDNFWNEELGAFVQERGGDTMDAACLLMPLVRFISPTDPRWLSTLAMVDARLSDDSLVRRYDCDTNIDGLAGTEGTFNMCSFWYIECIARSGDLDRARFLFEKMLGYANHLGLFAEETGPAGEHLGNFPQAFTHLALISAAFYLNRALDEGTGRR